MRWRVALVVALGACAPAVDDTVDPGAAFATCEAPVYPPQQLRLLTRAEYEATIQALFPALDSRCSTDIDCEITEASCVAGTCSPDPCSTVTFLLPAPDGPYTSAHVAGTFNGWAATIADGGWPMTWLPSEKAYVAKRVVPDGEHAYKLVVDDGARWLPDPSNPATTPDGFGGQNSVLVQACAGAGAPEAKGFAADLPAENKPPGFRFDNHADAGLVTRVHLERYLEAAADIAGRVVPDATDDVACLDDASCREGFVRDLVARATRAPADDAMVQRLVARVADADAGPERLELLLRVLLTSPQFLYRTELGVASGDGTYVLTPHETASALSYFLWGTPPDAALVDAADAGELGTPEGLEAQARRLLADPRARATVARFATQWLDVGAITSADKNPSQFPGFTPALRQALLAETQTFVNHVVFDGSQQLQELFTADYTFVNDANAGLYELPAPPSSTLVKTDHADDRRAGVLGHGSVLAVNAHSDQTSPIRRGVFVRELLLCHDLPDPPPDAGGVPEVDPDATTRERFAQHTANTSCAACHQYIDDIGFGFEHLDADGSWRLDDGGHAIDARGDVRDLEGLGTKTDAPFASVPELGAVLAASDSARTCFARAWLRYAIGREEAEADCSLDVVDDAFAQADGDIQELLIAITTSPSFVRRRPADATP